MAIDIKQLNQDYTKDKNALARVNALKPTIDGWEADIFAHKKNYAVKSVELDHARAQNNKAEIQRLEGEMQTILKDVQALKAKVARAQQTIDKAQQKVDEKLAQLSQDPETKKKLDSILYKKYDRKCKAEEKKKSHLETIKQVADNHPTVKKLLTGIEGYNKSIKSCNRIINKLSTKTPLTPAETLQLGTATVELSQSQAKLAARQADLVAYFATNHPEISKDTLEGLHSYGDINRQMQGCDKTITNCTKAMGNLTVSQELKNFTNPGSALPVPATKPSFWRHPIKWAQYQWNARKAPTSPVNTQSKNEQRKAFKDELKLSKDEYNAEIVQKYLENYEKGLHEAAKSNRNKNDGSR